MDRKEKFEECSIYLEKTNIYESVLADITGY